MRLFVAVEITDVVRDALAAEQQRLASSLRDRAPRFTRADQLHFTLVFVGQVNDERVPLFESAMTVPMARDRFEITIGHVGVFPDRGAPRILWVGVTAGADEMVGLQQAVATRLDALDVRRDARPYRPHLTLGRWRESRPSDATLVRSEPAAAIARMPVHTVTLFRSVLSPSGSTYTAVARCPLT